ncbi:MAG: hypothetical protein KDD94_13850 [Calditrichaeota bacterium]|nr:hypothetical protein [Calditrichota bacterium]
MKLFGYSVYLILIIFIIDCRTGSEFEKVNLSSEKFANLSDAKPIKQKLFIRSISTETKQADGYIQYAKLISPGFVGGDMISKGFEATDNIHEPPKSEVRYPYYNYNRFLFSLQIKCMEHKDDCPFEYTDESDADYILDLHFLEDSTYARIHTYGLGCLCGFSLSPFFNGKLFTIIHDSSIKITVLTPDRLPIKSFVMNIGSKAEYRFWDNLSYTYFNSPLNSSSDNHVVRIMKKVISKI